MTTRTYQHIIDTRSIKKVLNALPNHWVVRELTERDYGIDLHIEVFNKINRTQTGHDAFESTGNLLNIQVKGTDIAVKPSKESTVDISLHRKHLTYYEKFAIPFILFRVDVSSDSGEIYYVWLQKYIKKKLDYDSPEWRMEERCHPDGKIIEPRYKVKIPVKNILSDDIEKLEKISSKIKYLEELTEYIELFSEVHRVTEDISAGHYQANQGTYEWLVGEVNKISRLNVLIKVNNCGISSIKVRDLYDHFFNIQVSSDSSGIADYPHKEGLLRLLEVEAFSNLATEELQDELCGTTIY